MACGFANWAILGRFVSIKYRLVKIEQLIVQHLYKQKEVTLQGIGTIRLNPDVVLPADTEKDFTMPDNAFGFQYNLKAGEDEALIDHIVQQTRKMKALASSDMESYAMLAKQFLNIGKPLVIEGVGTIQKNQIGNYEFIAGHFVTPKIDDIPKQLREKRDESVSFESEAKTDNSRRNVLMVVSLLFIGMAIFAAWYFISNRKPSTPVEPIATEQIPVIQNTVKKDTIAVIKPDSIPSVVAAPLVKDSNSFSIVIKDYSTKDAAEKAYARLSTYGHTLKVVTVDSTHFQLTMPFEKPLTDTTVVRDSLKKFFGGKPYVKLF